jgi:hypothetical protein
MDEIDDEMAAVMGFSSFNPVPKPKRQKLSNPSGEQRTSANMIPLGQPKPKPRQAPQNEEEDADFPSYDDTTLNVNQGSNQANSTYGQQNARQPLQNSGTNFAETLLQKSLSQLGPEDLSILRRGVKMSDGRTVFFLPKFIEANPWSRFDKKP